MSGELMPYVNGEVKPVGREKGVARAAQGINDRVRVAGFHADASLALAGHVMEGVAGLDSHRRKLAGDDPALNMMLLDVEYEALNNVKSIQRRFSGGFAL